jgi:hypothetical protein
MMLEDSLISLIQLTLYRPKLRCSQLSFRALQTLSPMYESNLFQNARLGPPSRVRPSELTMLSAGYRCEPVLAPQTIPTMVLFLHSWTLSVDAGHHL